MSPTIPLTIDNIRSTLATTHLGQHLFLHREIPSTNSEAMALAQAGSAHGTVVVADRQTAGRGRQARAWFSPPDVNLYCSILIRPTELHIPLADWLSWIPLTAAIASAEAVHTVTGVSLSLKWPNDLLLNGKKVGGILCESGTGCERQPYVVVGLGLNVNVPTHSFSPELAPIAGSLIEHTDRPTDRNRLLAQLLLELEQTLDELASQGPHRLMHAYTTRCVTIGRPVLVQLGEGRELVGIAQAIGRDGALHVRPSAGPLQRHAQPIVEVRAADVIHLRE